MKLTVFVAMLLIAVVTMNTSCKSKTSSSPIAKGDTARVVALYVDTTLPDIRHEIIYRVIQSAVNIDTTSDDKKLSWRTDSLYYRPIIDTIRNAITKLPVVDSAGRIRTEIKYVYIAKNMVWDTGIITDSAISRFKKYFPAKDSVRNPN